MRSFVLAVRFLTRIPVPGLYELDVQHWGRSLLYYPLVGLLVGCVALLPAYFLSAPAPVAAALVLIAWVLITGAMHLDGLGDSADAWMGGDRSEDREANRQASLDIMKDPRVGVAGVVAISLVLLLKYSSLQVIDLEVLWVELLSVPVVARLCVLVLFVATPYVRSEGIASRFLQGMPVRSVIFVVLATGAGVLLLMGWVGLILLASAAITLMMLRKLMMNRLGGTTGDTAGALIEITEAVLLLVLAVY